MLLDLVVKRSDGLEDIYLVESNWLVSLLERKFDFVEVPTPKTPGIRFITLRYRDGQ